MRKLISMALLLLSFSVMGDVLLWMVDENTTVDGNPIQQFLVEYPSDDDNWPAARVKLVSSDGTTSRILRIYFGEGIEEDGDWGAELMDSGNGWGAGAPRGLQSRTGYNTIGTIQGQLSGDIPSYPPEVLEALLIMELGYNSWDDDVGDYVWRTLAESSPETYADLRQHMYAESDIGPSSPDPWSPDFYTTVPEPSISILVIVGFSVLALRRETWTSN